MCINSATSASGGFPISHPPIQTHPCPRICNQLYRLLLFSAGWASSWYLGSLDRVLRSAARLVGGLSKFSSITAYMCDVLHWLPISARIQYRITAMVSRCVLGYAPSYLRDLCCPVSVLAARRVLRSVEGLSFWSLVLVCLLCSEGPFGCGSISMEWSPL